MEAPRTGKNARKRAARAAARTEQDEQHMNIARFPSLDEYRAMTPEERERLREACARGAVVFKGWYPTRYTVSMPPPPTEEHRRLPALPRAELRETSFSGACFRLRR